MRRNLTLPVDHDPIQPARQCLGHGAGYGSADVLTRIVLGQPVSAHDRALAAARVSTSGPFFVTATVCSKCADRLPSRVTAVQPSDSIFTPGLPTFTIGSIASVMPSARRGPRPGSP